MSSGTPDHRQQVTRWPDDPGARAALEEWWDRGPRGALYGIGLDFRGANLTGTFIDEAWLFDSDFRDTTLRGADLPAAHLDKADFSGADLTSIILSNATAAVADFSRALLSGANLRSVEASGSRLSSCDLSGAEIGGGFGRADFRGADLRRAALVHLDLREAHLAGIRCDGAHGTVIGPFLIDDDRHQPVGEGDAERWFAARGADVEVLSVDGGAR